MQRTDIHIEHLAQFHLWMEGDRLSDKAKNSLRCILHYLEHNGSMAESAVLFGTTSHALHRWLNQFDPADPHSLEHKSHRPRTVRTSQIPAHVAAWIREYRVAEPKIGKREIAQRLLEKHQVVVSASAIGRVIERDSLYFADSPLHIRKRLKARMVMPEFVVPEPPRTNTEPVFAAGKPVERTSRKKKWLVTTMIISALIASMFLGYSSGKETANILQKEVPMSVANPPSKQHAPFIEPLLQLFNRYEP